MARKNLLLADFDVSWERGFLPKEDPLTEMPVELEFLDYYGDRLPELVESGKLLTYAKSMPIPPEEYFLRLNQRQLQLAWNRYTHIQSAYAHIQKTRPFSVCRNIAGPVMVISGLLKVKPILSYFSYVLHNWKRKDPNGPIKVDNLELIQTFSRDPDQAWFNLIHADIENEYGAGVSNLWNATLCIRNGLEGSLEYSLARVNESIRNMITIMKRMPEGTSPKTYDKIRRWIMSFEGVIYEGVDEFDGKPQTFRGQTGAQTSIFQSLEAGMQMPRLAENKLSIHLFDMRNYMLPKHREFIEYLEANSRVRETILASFPGLIDLYDECVFNILTFLAIHLGYAFYYIHKQTSDPRGTGGTDFMDYLGSRIKERWDKAFIKPRSEEDFQSFKMKMRQTVKELVAA